MTSHLVNDGIVKTAKLEYLENGTELFYEIKKLLSVPQITHFEKQMTDFVAEVTFICNKLDPSHTSASKFPHFKKGALCVIKQ